MNNRVNCQNCGGRVEIPVDYSRAKIRCGGCGYYADVPANMRSTGEEAPPAPPPRPKASDPPQVARAAPAARAAAPKARPQADPQDPRPKFEPEEDGPRGKPLLEGTQDEEDDKPYAVPGTGTKRCPECRGELPLSAALCVHCGLNLVTNERAKKRKFEPIDREWEEGWSMKVRLQILIAFVAVDFLTFIILLLDGDAPVGIMGLAVQIGLQAFLLGTYDILRVERTPKGQATLTRTRKLAFLQMQVTKVKWKKSEGMSLVGSQNPGIFAWLMCFYMCTFCLAPGILFYWFIIRPQRFEVTLCDTYGGTDEVIFRETDRDRAHEVGRIASEATGLWYRAVK